MLNSVSPNKISASNNASNNEIRHYFTRHTDFLFLTDSLAAKCCDSLDKDRQSEPEDCQSNHEQDQAYTIHYKPSPNKSRFVSLPIKDGVKDRTENADSTFEERHFERCPAKALDSSGDRAEIDYPAFLGRNIIGPRNKPISRELSSLPLTKNGYYLNHRYYPVLGSRKLRAAGSCESRHSIDKFYSDRFRRKWKEPQRSLKLASKGWPRKNSFILYRCGICHKFLSHKLRTVKKHLMSWCIIEKQVNNAESWDSVETEAMITRVILNSPQKRTLETFNFFKTSIESPDMDLDLLKLIVKYSPSKCALSPLRTSKALNQLKTGFKEVLNSVSIRDVEEEDCRVLIPIQLSPKVLRIESNDSNKSKSPVKVKSVRILTNSVNKRKNFRIIHRAPPCSVISNIFLPSDTSIEGNSGHAHDFVENDLALDLSQSVNNQNLPKGSSTNSNNSDISPLSSIENLQIQTNFSEYNGTASLKNGCKAQNTDPSLFPIDAKSLMMFMMFSPRDNSTPFALNQELKSLNHRNKLEICENDEQSPMEMHTEVNRKDSSYRKLYERFLEFQHSKASHTQDSYAIASKQNEYYNGHPTLKSPSAHDASHYSGILNNPEYFYYKSLLDYYSFYRDAEAAQRKFFIAENSGIDDRKNFLPERGLDKICDLNKFNIKGEYDANPPSSFKERTSLQIKYDDYVNGNGFDFKMNRSDSRNFSLSNSGSNPNCNLSNSHRRQTACNGKHLCVACGKRFNTSYHLKRHSYVHTGLKPYNCVVCLKSFAERSHFVNHTCRIKPGGHHNRLNNYHSTMVSNDYNDSIDHNRDYDPEFAAEMNEYPLTPIGDHKKHNGDSAYDVKRVKTEFEPSANLQTNMKHKFSIKAETTLPPAIAAYKWNPVICTPFLLENILAGDVNGQRSDETNSSNHNFKLTQPTFSSSCSGYNYNLSAYASNFNGSLFSKPVQTPEYKSIFANNYTVSTKVQDVLDCNGKTQRNAIRAEDFYRYYMANLVASGPTKEVLVSEANISTKLNISNPFNLDASFYANYHPLFYNPNDVTLDKGSPYFPKFNTFHHFENPNVSTKTAPSVSCGQDLKCPHYPLIPLPAYSGDADSFVVKKSTYKSTTLHYPLNFDSNIKPLSYKYPYNYVDKHSDSLSLNNFNNYLNCFNNNDNDYKQPNESALDHLSPVVTKNKSNNGGKGTGAHKKCRVKKLHPCDACGKEFRDSYHLKRHYYLHTGKKPFTCERCGKSYAEQSHLRIHKCKVAAPALPLPSPIIIPTDDVIPSNSLP
ncbi:unnamed protein product [Gordionus sp. m RMFG-2023]|uniref:uncharacterized protein LOC135931602 n=1 Tax=Gordionus sp. m RMFG-2023 TaxID=3053472 RepID=UPI0030E0D3F0